eukprot:1434529-Rhodomonas_salina.2
MAVPNARRCQERREPSISSSACHACLRLTSVSICTAAVFAGQQRVFASTRRVTMAPVVCVLALFIHSCVGFNTAPGLGFRGSSLSSQRATNSLSRPFSTAKVAPARGVRGVLGLRASTERSEVQTQTEDEEEARREKMEK